MIELEVVGDYAWALEENDLTIKKISADKTVKITDVVWATGREDFLEGVYTTAVETLEGAEHCCYEGKVFLLENKE
jgi:hypothetical protein